MKPTTFNPLPPCTVCKNTRHLYRGAEVVRCECIREYQRLEAYAAAGVSPIHHQTPIDALVSAAGLSRLRRVFEQPLRAPFLGCMTIARVHPARPAVVAAVLRLALDRQRTAKAVSLDQCIATRFNEDERPSLYREFETLHTLVVDLDVQIVNRMVPQLCMDIYTRRVVRPCVTVFLSAEPLTLAAARYGVELVTAYTGGQIRRIEAPRD